MIVDKNYCMSSFLAFRYIVNDDVQFAEDLKHQIFKQIPDTEKTFVRTAEDIDRAIQYRFSIIQDKEKGILLSGGMDSAILASYMSGSDAYTFRFMGGTYQKEELSRAEYFAHYYGLKLHYVDIDWKTVEANLNDVMRIKGSPVHSIEPQVCAAAKQAQKDGIEMMVIGDASDYVFGGMNKLLAKNWDFEEFYRRYIYVNPYDVLVNPCDMHIVMEKYRLPNNKVSFLNAINEITVDESYASYQNAFKAAGMLYIDPYENLKMLEPLDLKRIRAGESKYLIRQLFQMKYPDVPIPEKLPMPRPVNQYFANWDGPHRAEFKKNIEIEKLNGNQKWLIWCLEEFLNLYC